MRILQVHNFYRQAGGEDRVVQAEYALLHQQQSAIQSESQQGLLQIDTFYVYSTQSHDQYNEPFDERQRSPQSAGAFMQRCRRVLRVLIEVLLPTTVLKRFRQQLSSADYDIVHFHNLFPLLSPAMLLIAKQQGCKNVLTLHNFRLAKPSAVLAAGEQLAPLTKAALWQQVMARTYRQSLLATALMAAYIYYWRNIWQTQIDLFVCPSQFVKQQFMQFGLPIAKLWHKPHFCIDTMLLPSEPKSDASFGVKCQTVAFDLLVPHAKACQQLAEKLTSSCDILFVGRVCADKGVMFLLEAWHQQTTPLYLAGPLDPAFADDFQHKLASMPQVHWLGALPQWQLIELYQQAKLLVVPSMVAETFGNVVIEAFAAGTAVLAAEAGALAELVQPNWNGALFKAGDLEQFKLKINTLLADPALLQHMGKQARNDWQLYYSPAAQRVMLQRMYESLLAE